MNSGVEAYFSSGNEAYLLHSDMEIKEKISGLPKGWVELVKLEKEDRIGFVSAFWRKALPFHPHLDAALDKFFSSLEDIGVYIVKNKREEDWHAELVYSLSNDVTFYRGFPSLFEKEEMQGIESVLNATLPVDYKAFLTIHNGFSKDGDTGVIPSYQLSELALKLWEEVKTQGKEVTFKGEAIAPQELIPFYQSYGRESYQCFYKSWYPAGEMGNVCFNLSEATISNFHQKISGEQTLAFPTFIDWLIFYLEAQTLVTRHCSF